MYCDFYGLKEVPFNVTADPHYLFFSRKHREAFSHLVYGVEQKKGIIVLTGEIGTGKTTLCRAFLNQISKKVKSAFIINPSFSGRELLRAILEDFGIRSLNKNKFSLLSNLNKFLLRQKEVDNNAVLIIDEAQNLKTSELEQIRLLSNLETEKEKLLQIILVGQPELNRRIQLYNLRQLRQRIMVNYHILPLDEDEVSKYIYHRLTIAGSDGRIKFSLSALKKIYEFSSGIPRLINFICDRALLLGFIREKREIDEEILNICIKDFDQYK
ncbi:MAG: AAA family ATPase [Candidatus Omnitrophica bacterium]|nr:AAA family ATPase [Candidatus Omnitrophota bacterium]